MSLRLRKSFKLPGGFRVNLSTRGIGASWGVPGFRVGTGPSGTRAHMGIPDTGIGWNTGFGGSRRVGASGGGQYRQLLAAQRDSARFAEVERCSYEVRLHEQHLRALVSLHQEGWTTWDWHAIAASPRPIEPARQHPRESAASYAARTYQPAIDKLLGADRRIAELQQAIVAARAHDEYEFAQQHAAFQEEFRRWEWFQRVSRGVIGSDSEACQAVLDYLGPFQDFQQLGSSLNVAITRGWCVEAWFTANDERVVPSEKLSLTSTGKTSRRKMPVGEYWALYQDHVCSAALRIAREVFALLPIPVTMVHVGYPHTNGRTGQPDTRCILSTAFDRETFGSLNLDALDPSDSMANFEHRMQYKKTSGFDPIEPLSPDDLNTEGS